MIVMATTISEQTVKERKFLLLTSAVGLFISFTGSVPTKFSALGIEFSAKEQNAFVVAVIATVIYFMLAFVIYGWSDFLRWRIEYQKLIEADVRDMLNWSREDQEKYDQDEIYFHINRLNWPYKLRKPTVLLVVAFEYILPPIVSVISVLSLLCYVCKT